MIKELVNCLQSVLPFPSRDTGAREQGSFTHHEHLRLA